MFLREDSKIKITALLDLSWEHGDQLVKGRPHAALSLRIKGDSFISQGGKNVNLSDGDVLYVPKGEDYYKKSGKERLIVVHFDTDDTVDNTIRAYHPDNSLLIESLFTSLYKIWQEKLPGYYFSALSVFYRILYELEGNKESGYYAKIKSACDYLHENYTAPSLTVKELAQRCYMSEPNFRRVFFEVYGRTPLSYISYLRIEHAKALLSELRISMGEVAERCGFSDVKYFSTVFKKHVGIQPSKYR
jgi:AraC-like DNA-binding protein